jgi:hypothetical protein
MKNTLEAPNLAKNPKPDSHSKPKSKRNLLIRAALLLGVLIIIVIGVVLIIATSSNKTTTQLQTPTLATRGATIPYTEIEAEAANTNGTILGPDRTFTHIAAEASGRQAVKLDAPGQYVEFTLPQAANSIVVRYSVPDNADGTGITTPLSLYVGGVRQPDLSLTSKYSWFYGKYPFSNDPMSASPHHYFDETHALLAEMPAGTKVRLQVDPNDIASWYIIDLADFEEVAAPLPQPTGSLAITDFGADPTGVQDSTEAMNKAVAAGTSQGKVVWIPRGTFNINSHIILDKVTVRGAGPWYSILHGNGIGMYGNAAPNPSQNVQMYDFAIFGEITDRKDYLQVNAIGGALGGGSIIQNLWIEHTKVGMWFDGPFSGLTITGCRIRDVTADGLNLHQGISNVVVQQNIIRNTGDDGLAMWSEKQADHDNVFKFNTVTLPVLANNIAIYGGFNNSITDNMVADTLTEGGGIHVGNRFKSVAISDTTTIARNTLIRTGVLDPNWHFGVGAIWFYALDTPMSGAINVSDNQIEDSSYEAIQFTGLKITNVSIDHVNIKRTGTFAIQEQASGKATFSYVTATDLGSGGQYNCGSEFQVVMGAGNSGWDDTHCGSLTTPPTSK